MPAEFESGVFTDNLPAWHNLGLVVPDAKLTAAQVLNLVPELAAPVEQYPLMAVLPNGQTITIDGYRANVRMSARPTPVGIVQGRYHILQSTDAFTFMDDLVDSGEAKYKTAGTLKGGSVQWMLMELPDTVALAGMESERVQQFIFLSNSHDGSSRVTVASTNVRIVCQNTLSMALAGTPRKFQAKHTKSLDGRMNEARKALQVAFKYTEALSDLADNLLHVPWSDAHFGAFLDGLVPMTNDDGTKVEGSKDTRRGNVRATISQLYHYSDNLKPVRDTAWAALQASVEFADHRMTRKNTQTSTAEENRFDAIIVNGDGPTSFSQKALNTVLAMTGAGK